MKTAVDWLVDHVYRVIPNEERNFLEGLRKEALEMEQKQLKEMYLKGIENYDPTFKRKSQWTPVNKKEQKQHIVDIMKADEKDGLYNEPNK